MSANEKDIILSLLKINECLCLLLSEVDDFLKQRRLEIIKEECYYCGEDIEPNEENKLTDSIYVCDKCWEKWVQ